MTIEDGSKSSPLYPAMEREPTYFDYVGSLGRDLRGFWSRIWNERRILAATVVVALVVGVLVAVLSPREFINEAIVATPENSNGGISGTQRLIKGFLRPGGGGGGMDSTELTIALQTRSVIYPVIDELNLKRVFFPTQWDDANGRWKVRKRGMIGTLLAPIRDYMNGGPAPVLQDGPSMADAYLFFTQRLGVIPDPSADVIHVSFRWYDSGQSAQIVNALVKELNDLRRDAAIVRSQKRISNLKAQLSRATATQMQQVIYDLIGDETKSLVDAESNGAFAARFIDPATASPFPSSPKRGQIVFLSLIGGIIVGSLLALLAPSLRSRFGNRKASGWKIWRRARVQG